MNQANLAMLERTLEQLGEIAEEVVFVGGATIELWITDAAAPEFRPTDDVDVIVEVSTRRDYYRLEERLREAGFENDQESGDDPSIEVSRSPAGSRCDAHRCVDTGVLE